MRKCLSIGINDYHSSPLTSCVGDAEGIATMLERNSDSTPNFHVRRLLAPPESLTRSVLREAISNLFDGNDDITLLYFSGHGMFSGRGGYIVTTDFKRYDEGIAMDEILGIANESKAKNKIIILDCCHSGAFGSPVLTGDSKALLSEGLTVLTASRPTESAYEGVFTPLLLQALEGGASDLLGNITPGAVYAFIDRALGAWDQRPIFKTNVTRFCSLRQVPPPIPLDILRNLTVYFPDPAVGFQLDPSYEFTDDSAVPEHIAILKELQRMVSVGLVVPVDEEHMYFAAMNSKSCRLTAFGNHYWHLANRGML